MTPAKPESDASNKPGCRETLQLRQLLLELYKDQRGFLSLGEVNSLPHQNPPSSKTDLKHLQHVYHVKLDFGRFYRIACASKIKIVASKLLVLVLALALAQASIAQSNISFEWVTVGDPGNPNDPLTGISSDVPPPSRGAVPYVYSISKYETTIGQYAAFLNAVAKSDPHGLYNPDLGNRDSIRGVSRTGTDGNYVYYVKNVSSVLSGLTSANLPITYITYPNAVRFVNWLHNGQGNGSTETGAYTISEGQITRASRTGGVVTLTTAQPHSLGVGDQVTVSSFGPQLFVAGTFLVTARTDTTFSYLVAREDFPEQEFAGSMTGISATHRQDARYWIPTENEWYKAAYYDPSPQGPADHYWLYPWRSDEVNGRPANFYNGTFTVTNRPNLSLSYTYLTDVRGFSASPEWLVLDSARGF
jgi:formylglycine-generating enzyme required for sulfatase activity